MGQSWGPALGARVGRASGFLNMGRNKCSLSRRAARPRHPGTLRHLTRPFGLGPSLFGLPEPPYPPRPAPPSAVLLRPRADRPRPAVCHRNYATSHLDPPFAAPTLSAADTSCKHIAGSLQPNPTNRALPASAGDRREGSGGEGASCTTATKGVIRLRGESMMHLVAAVATESRQAA